MSREMKVIQNIQEDKELEVSYEWIEFNQTGFDQIELAWTEYS
jgi:hypothetical protein